MKADLKKLHDIAHEVGKEDYVQQLSIELYYGDKEHAESMLDEFYEEYYASKFHTDVVGMPELRDRCSCCDANMEPRMRKVMIEPDVWKWIPEDFCPKCIEKSAVVSSAEEVMGLADD